MIPNVAIPRILSREFRLTAQSIANQDVIDGRNPSDTEQGIQTDNIIVFFSGGKDSRRNPSDTEQGIQTWNRMLTWSYSHIVAIPRILSREFRRSGFLYRIAPAGVAIPRILSREFRQDNPKSTRGKRKALSRNPSDTEQGIQTRGYRLKMEGVRAGSQSLGY